MKVHAVKEYDRDCLDYVSLVSKFTLYSKRERGINFFLFLEILFLLLEQNLPR